MPEPFVQKRKVLLENRWISVREKMVSFDGGVTELDFYSLELPHYVCAVAQTLEGLYPLIRQYRPAVERFGWEFPSGTLEAEESPGECACRELLEETGYFATSVIQLCDYSTDVGRLENRIYGFFLPKASKVPNYIPEDGIEVKLLAYDEVESLIESGEFDFALHLAVWGAYKRHLASG